MLKNHDSLEPKGHRHVHSNFFHRGENIGSQSPTTDVVRRSPKFRPFIRTVLGVRISTEYSEYLCYCSEYGEYLYHSSTNKPIAGPPSLLLITYSVHNFSIGYLFLMIEDWSILLLFYECTRIVLVCGFSYWVVRRRVVCYITVCFSSIPGELCFFYTLWTRLRCLGKGLQFCIIVLEYDSTYG